MTVGPQLLEPAIALLFGDRRGTNRLLNTLAWLVGINILLAGLSFVTTLLIANVLGRDGFGQLSYALAIGTYYFTIACCGLERTLVRDLVQSPNHFDDYYSANLALRGTMLVIGFVGITILNFAIPAGKQLDYDGLLIVFAMGLKALDLAPIFDAWDEMKRHALYSAVEKIMYVASVWGVVATSSTQVSIRLVAILMLASTAVGFALQFGTVSPRVTFRMVRGTISLGAKMLRENIWIWSSVLATLSFGGLSKIVLMLVDGPAELGSYSVAWQVVALGSMFIAQIARIGNPRIAKIAGPGTAKVARIQFLTRYLSIMLLAASVICAPVALLSNAIITRFLPAYIDAAVPMAILGVYVLVVGIGQVATQYLVAVRNERFIAITVILSGLVGLGLYAVLIPRWQAVGAALAVLISHAGLVALHLTAVVIHLRSSE